MPAHQTHQATLLALLALLPTTQLNFSVIRLIVSLLILAPYTSSKCAAISPVVNPRAGKHDLISAGEPALALADDLRPGRRLGVLGTSISTGLDNLRQHRL